MVWLGGELIQIIPLEFKSRKMYFSNMPTGIDYSFLAVADTGMDMSLTFC